MRTIDECRAEVFRRSEEKIKARRRARARAAALCVPLCLCAVIMSVAFALPRGPRTEQDMMQEDGEAPGGAPGTEVVDGGRDEDVTAPAGTADPLSFSFSLTWNVFGISSYDSVTGRLIKTTDATRPEDYVTTYRLTDEETARISELIRGLDIDRYPDVYDPQAGNIASDPSMTLILSVRMGETEKTVTAKNIALTYESDDPDGQRFLDVCREIIEILTGTEAWQSLPEYEFFYD